MKRPEGFDKPVPEPQRRHIRPRLARKKPDVGTSHSSPSRSVPVRAGEGASSIPDVTPQHETRLARSTPALPRAEENHKKNKSRSRRISSPMAIASKQLRQAARARKRAERAELRRFTRRARKRKLTVAALCGVVVLLLGLISVAVFSPILSLRTVVVDGANRIDPAEIQAAVETQRGTPLALLDFDKVTDDLSVFPLIRSYVTEIVPPDTLLVHIVEREPIGTVKVGGVFRLVDPAGITIQESAERIPGVPLIEVGEAAADGAAFVAVTEVLLSLPAELRARVESAAASTKDDVSFVLAGVGQRVVWGSASNSARKAALLDSLISITDEGRRGEFDVSAPGNGIFRPSP